MLRKEVDYVPLSPKKPGSGPVQQPVLTPKTGGHRKSLSASASLQLRTRSGLGLGTGAGAGAGTGREVDESVLGSPPPASHVYGHHRHQSSATAAGVGRHLSEEIVMRTRCERERGSSLDVSFSISESERERERRHESRREKERETERGREGPHGHCWKTTEEKKELLGTMLGNVDALVEGVRKAGIWGLG